MCGICGKLYFEAGRSVKEETLRKMCAEMTVRGPDDEGIYLSGAFGMGMRRLAIIDLETGQQPLANEDGSIRLVCNGEIYNFKSLRKRLESAGHRFQTRTDAEVILHLYEDLGIKFIDHIRGMFGLALWDDRRKRLILARDRLGIKPLYYRIDDRGILFASTIKPLLAGGAPRELNFQALHDYLSFNYVPGEESIFRGIKKLLPAHILICEEGAVRRKRYWSVQFADRDSRTLDEAREGLEEVLLESLRLHLVSDRPLGVFLSGGLDSSSIVALIRRIHGGNLSTFTIGFKEKSYDESELARLVAERYQTEHHELTVDIKPDRILPELIEHFDEPFADSSAIPVFYLSKMAAEKIVVALGGDGGDEIFAGYLTYTAMKLARLYQRLPRFLSAGLIPAIVKRLPVSRSKISFDFKAKRFMTGALLNPDLAHYHWKLWFTEEEKRKLYADRSPALKDSWRLLEEVFSRCRSRNLLSRMQFADSHYQLADDMCVKVDRMTMASSLELRVPFLYGPVVEFVAGLDPEMRMKRLDKKYILKRLMERKIPRQILEGKKRGFNVPMARWIAGPLKELVLEVLSPRQLRKRGIFNPAAVSRLIDDHLSNRVENSRQIWALLVFNLWSERYLD